MKSASNVSFFVYFIIALARPHRTSMSVVVKIAGFVVGTADRQTQRIINLPHPNRISSGKIVVDGYHMDALAGNGVKIRRQSGDQSFSFASPHLGDFPLMQNNSAKKLDVKMPLTERSSGRFSCRRKRFRQNFVQRLSVIKPVS